ncbi:uncharacterized protein LOC131267315 [Anopheles coustani]|uniref:uncharacterized protein LOC131267315 n=1 Tax=Anopheles coustani TaxID=139045 RepID=UPI0026597D0B|nr:uncharacterized protein LOC131267315 [Anopheles coustani]
MLGALAGAKYQQQLLLVILYHVAKLIKGNEDIEITSEDPTGGMFDDIGVRFKVGNQWRKLFIQAKYKDDMAKTITLDDLTSTDKKAPFAISKYFNSFLEEEWNVTKEPPVLVLCTNIGLAEEVKTTGVEYPFGQKFIDSILKSISNVAYQIDPNTNSSLCDYLKNNSELNNLAKQVVQHIHNKTPVDFRNPLLQKYRNVIENNIATENCQSKECYQVNEAFFKEDGTQEFTNAFEQEYQKLLKENIDTVWEDIRTKGIRLKKGKPSVKSDPPEINQLPKQIDDKQIEKFFGSFILLSETNHEMDRVFSILLENRMLPVELQEIASFEIIYAYFAQKILEWMQNSHGEPLTKQNIQDLVKYDTLLLSFLQLKAKSKSYCDEMQISWLQCKPDIVKRKKLYEALETWSTEEKNEENCYTVKIQHCNNLPLIVAALELLKCDYIFMKDEWLKNKSIFRDIMNVFNVMKFSLIMVIDYKPDSNIINMIEWLAQDMSPKSQMQLLADTLVKEIQTLNDMIRHTEQKWNNLLHLKKVKEEILLRLNRRKHVIGITETRLGEVSAFSHLDSSNLSSHHQLNQQRSSSVGPRPPTPPPEVEIRPASVSTTMHYNNNASNGLNSFGGKHSQIPNRRNSSITTGSIGHNDTGGRRTGSTRDTNNFVSQFNSNNNAVTMVPLPNTTSMILQARASMNSAEIAKEKAAAMQVQRQLFPKPVLSNQQQILNNLAMSAGLTSLTSGAGNSNSSNMALLNGHHNPSVSSVNSGGTTSREQQQLQIGRQGMRKDVSSIIADYRQKHPENVPRRGRRMKHVGGSSGSNNGGISTGNSIGSFVEGSAISLTALPGGKSATGMGSAARSSSTDSVANRLSDLLAAAEQSPQHFQHQQQQQLTTRPVPATANNFNSFSPTLARLLTGPERMNAVQPTTSSSSTVTSGALANLQTAGVIGGLNLSKNNSEISITPVVGSNFQQTLLAQQQQQQQQQHQQLQRLREQHLFKGESYLNIDDEADDSADRLVIDEGDDMAGSHRDAISKRRVAEINENEVPQCQGCKKNEAKFVCAGCNHQWYCSRECQVNAWDDHSEVCSG